MVYMEMFVEDKGCYFYEDLFKNDCRVQIIVDGENGNIIAANSSACEFYGYSEKEIIKLNINDLSHINDFEMIHYIPINSQDAEFNSRHKLSNGLTKNVRIMLSKTYSDKKLYFYMNILETFNTSNESKKIDRARWYLESADMMLLALDDKARITYVSRKCCEKLEYEEEELIGEDWFKLCLPAEEYDATLGSYNKLLSGEITILEYYENHAITKSGKERLISWHNTFLKDESGKIIGILSAGEDITERKLAEELSKKVEERQRKMLEKLPVAIILSAGIEQRMFYQNPRFFEFFGYSIEEFPLIKYWWELAYPDPEYRNLVSTEWNARLRWAIKNQSEIEPMEVRITAKDGSIKHVIVHASVFGEINFITFIDITERKTAEEALRLANAYNRSLIEASLDALVAIDPNGRITDVNSSTEKATGYSREELIGTDFSHYFIDRERVQKGNSKVLEGEAVRDYELEMKRRDGHTTTVSYNASAYKDESGRIIGIFAEARDICERIAREKELKKAKRAAEEANELKGQFLANMSHELRTPINVIFSAVQLFQIHFKNNPIHVGFDYNKHLQSMKQNCYRLLRLTNNIIDSNKLEAGFISLNKINIDVVKIIEDITLSVLEYARDKGIYVEFDTEIEEKIMALDSDKIERIMLNLLSNAIKFTPKNGKIFVNIYSRESSIIISVKDTGSGIPEDKIDQIFERFVQCDNLMTRCNEGSGIGLSIVKSFVEMHDGAISVTSKLGSGSEFLIEFPISNPPEKNYECHTPSKGIRNYAEVLNIEFSDIYK